MHRVRQQVSRFEGIREKERRDGASRRSSVAIGVRRINSR